MALQAIKKYLKFLKNASYFLFCREIISNTSSFYVYWMGGLGNTIISKKNGLFAINIHIKLDDPYIASIHSTDTIFCLQERKIWKYKNFHSNFSSVKKDVW